MSSKGLEHYSAVIGELLRVQRKTAVRLRNEGRINDEVMLQDRTRAGSRGNAAGAELVMKRR